MGSDLSKEETRKRSLNDVSACPTGDGSCPVSKLEMHETEVNCVGIDDSFVDASSTKIKKPRFMNKMGRKVDVPETSGKMCEQAREHGQNCSAELNTASYLSVGKNCEEKVLASDVEGSKDIYPAVINGQDCLAESSLSSVAASPITLAKKKLIVLDINGLLADVVFPIPKDHETTTTIAGRAVFKRPFCDDFLRFCFERFEVAVWSSRTRKNVGNLIDILMGDLRSKLLFCWDASHCTVTKFKTPENKHKPLVFKELRKIWEKHDPDLPERSAEYNKSNTLLIDDSPHKALLNPPHTAIFPYSYKFKDENDNSLGDGGDLKAYLERLDVAENVHEFVKENPFGQSAITEGSPNWSFYLEVMATCAPPDPSLDVHQENQRMNPLVDKDSGFERERKRVRVDKVLKLPPQAHWNYWNPPPRGHLKLNTKGSLRARGQSAAAGGLVRDELGYWRTGFAVNIRTPADWLTAELVGLFEGLQILREMRALGAVVEMDSDVALRLVDSRDLNNPYGALVRDCRFLLRQCYVSSIRHTHPKGNRCADSLANFGHSLPRGVTFLERHPIWLNRLLDEDMRGLTFHTSACDR